MIVVAQNLIIDRDVMTKIGKQVWPWEVLVLQCKFGGGKVRIEKGDTEEITLNALPDAATEMDRLERAHGSDGGSGVLYARDAYGRGPDGIKALKKAMKASVKNREKPKPKDEQKKAPDVQAQSKPQQGDPLDFG